jgi:hypothetical protein
LQGASQKKKKKIQIKNKTRPHYKGINLFTQKNINKNLKVHVNLKIKTNNYYKKN